MEPWALALMCVVALLAALVGVVTGGNSLFTVPVMLSLGMAPRQAIATNMFAVTFLALSGGVRFAQKQPVRWDLTLPLGALTLVTSWWGAHLVTSLSERTVRGVVAGSMVAMVLFLLARPGFGEAPAHAVSKARFAVGMAVGALLGIYGGLFSGGYTTLLTFACVALLGTSLVEAVGMTKLVNFASSAIASLEFARHGLIDYRVAVPMAAAMTVGAWLGAHLAITRGHRYVRIVFLGGVGLLAAKLVVFDLLLAR
ncbi:MAG: sulfite exporter TauE/SafE family protein [Myxococcales bacterium]|nr:sulfite exporter TauE/SafE family protein [Myxococcales bacterium]